MPIPIEDIEQAVQGSELVTTTYAACDGIVATEGAPYRKLPKDTYALNSHSEHPEITFEGTVLVVKASNDDLKVGGTTANTFILLQPEGYLSFFSKVQTKFTGTVFIQDDLKSSPPGEGISITADSFVEWSSAAIKENIRPLLSSKLLLVQPKLYEQKGESRAGLVVEDVEPQIPEAVRIFQDEEGKPVKGVIWGSIISHILWWLRNFEARLSALEVK